MIIRLSHTSAETQFPNDLGSCTFCVAAFRLFDLMLLLQYLAEREGVQWLYCAIAATNKIANTFFQLEYRRRASIKRLCINRHVLIFLFWPL